MIKGKAISHNLSNFEHLKIIYGLLSPKRRLQFSLLLTIMVLCSISEVLSIGVVLPFLSVLTSPEQIFEHGLAQIFIQIFSLTSPDQLLFPITLVFIVAALIAGAMRLLLVFVTTRLAYATGSDFSTELYRNSLYQSYEVHITRNSSEVINSAVTKINAAIQSTIIPVLIIISSIITLILILALLVTVEPAASMISIGVMSLIYILIAFVTKNRLSYLSLIAAKNRNEVVKLLQEGLNGIRDILIDGTQNIFADLYKNSDVPLRRAQGHISFIALSPRYAVEALAISFLAILAYTLSNNAGNIANSLPIIGVLAMGAQRLIPLMQQIYHSWSSIIGAQASVSDMLDFITQPKPSYYNQSKNSICTFDKHILLRNVDFSYTPNSPLVLKNINLKILKGSMVGFIGETGSGKSTLVDLIMGLIMPKNGTIEIDDVVIDHNNFRGWQKHVAHVPQSIFLIDNTIEKNIAFGVPNDKVDSTRIEMSAKKAQIFDKISKLPLRYKEIVGERGVKISGGERQRIGIARAFYKEADVFIFDEATSALDDITEENVMKSIGQRSEKITTIVIAHRLTTLKYCDQIFELKNGKISRTGSYDEIIGT